MGKKQPTDLDRLAIRERPEGQPIMHQDWGKLLFMHWRMDEKHLRPLIPERLEIDTFDGSAWIAVTPFTMWQTMGMAFVITVMGFLGGLTMSAIKRDAGVKDWGSSIQGHGGVLDRIDSICFAGPIFFHLTRR